MCTASEPNQRSSRGNTLFYAKILVPIPLPGFTWWTIWSCNKNIVSWAVSLLVQVMVCLSYYLSQYWLFVDETPTNQLQLNCNQIINYFLSKNTVQYPTKKNGRLSFRPHKSLVSMLFLILFVCNVGIARRLRCKIDNDFVDSNPHSYMVEIRIRMNKIGYHRRFFFKWLYTTCCAATRGLFPAQFTSRNVIFKSGDLKFEYFCRIFCSQNVSRHPVVDLKLGLLF